MESRGCSFCNGRADDDDDRHDRDHDQHHEFCFPFFRFSLCQFSIFLSQLSIFLLPSNLLPPYHAASQSSNPRPEPDPGTVDEGVIYDDDDFWYTQKITRPAYIIKWSIVGAIFFIFLLFLVMAYLHARSRMKKGMPPLAYHRWLISRRRRMQFDPTYQNHHMAYPINHRAQQVGYAANLEAPPPPVYNRNYDNAPPYLPPEGASKVKPDQADYAHIPPPGAPPTRSTDDAPAYTPPVAGQSTRHNAI